MKKAATVSKKKPFVLFGAPETDADLLYASRFPAPDPVIWIEARRKKILVVTDFERDRARRVSKADEVWGAQALALEHAKKDRSKKPDTSPAGLFVAALRKLNSRSIEVPESFPMGMAALLQRFGISVKTRPGPVYPERLCKTNKEIQSISKALRTCERALEAVVGLLRQSRIEKNRLRLFGRPLLVEDLRRIINLTLMEGGCVAAHTIVAPGDQAVDPHSEGKGPIRPGEPIVIDIFPRSVRSFYFADITRTFVKGRPSAALIRQYEAVLSAQECALSMIRPGLPVRSVHLAVQRVFERLGFPTQEENGRLQGFTHSTGHGVGLEIHEPPKIGQVDPSVRFQKGMVVTVEPGLYYLGTGGVRLEDMVVVTDRKARNLTRFPKFLCV
jgi:Xaa-Pro aminopeptidase